MSLIILRGISGSGKSKLANTIFRKHNILSSDDIRMEVFGTMNVSPSLTFIWDEVYRRLEMRCKSHTPTVYDATNLTGKSLKKVISYADKYGVDYHIVSITPDLEFSRKTLKRRASGEINGAVFGDDVLVGQYDRYNNNTKGVRDKYEGYFFEGTLEDCGSFISQYVAQMNHRVVYDDIFIIGDIHGKIHKLRKLLAAIPDTAVIYSVGDMIDRGEDSIQTIFELENDPRFDGFAIGNHEWSFLLEHMGLKECKSRARKRTHKELAEWNDESQEFFIRVLKDGKPYIIVDNPNYNQKILITHAGVESFDPLTVSLEHTIGDRINAYKGMNKTPYIQVHGHKSWEYNGDFTGSVVNVDSGCYSTEVLTAFNPFTREVIHV